MLHLMAIDPMAGSSTEVVSNKTAHGVWLMCVIDILSHSLRESRRDFILLQPARRHGLMKECLKCAVVTSVTEVVGLAYTQDLTGKIHKKSTRPIHSLLKGDFRRMAIGSMCKQSSSVGKCSKVSSYS